MIVQSVTTQDEFFKKLFNELLDKEIFEGLDGYLQKASSAVKRYASRITGSSIDGWNKKRFRIGLDKWGQFTLR